jgi:hypothetical protein
MASTLKSRPIDLLPGEAVLKAWDASQRLYWPWNWGLGVLQLTSERLIFMRPPVWPGKEEVVMVPLSEVENRVGRRAVLNSRGVVELQLRSGQRLRFYPPPVGIPAKEIASAINNILRETARTNA